MGRGAMTVPVSMRTRFLRLLLDQAGQPYEWGGKGVQSNPRYFGFDCSGLVTWAYHAAGGPDWRETHNANTLLHVLPPPRLQVLRGGELVFYGRPDGTPGVEPGGNADHVMVYLGGSHMVTDAQGLHLADGLTGLLWGACGGGHLTTTREAAAAMPDGGARVRAREGLDYRHDRIAIRDIRFPDEP
jgi:murein DD-endopeptidase